MKATPEVIISAWVNHFMAALRGFAYGYCSRLKPSPAVEQAMDQVCRADTEAMSITAPLRAIPRWYCFHMRLNFCPWLRFLW